MPRTFARAFRIGILPAMPGRGHRLPAARAIAACLAVAAGAMLAGCDGGHSTPRAVEDDPTTSAPLVTPGPTTSPIAPPTSATGPAGPTPSITGESALNSAFPSAAAAGPHAVEVVRAFYDGINREIDTGDESTVSKYFQSSCTRCISEVVAIQHLLDGQHKVRGGHLHITRIDSVHPSYSNIVTVTITGTADASQQLDSKGNVTQSFDAVPPTQLVFDVVIDENPPVIANLTLASG